MKRVRKLEEGGQPGPVGEAKERMNTGGTRKQVKSQENQGLEDVPSANSQSSKGREGATSVLD